jgi:hypothetical protein
MFAGMNPFAWVSAPAKPEGKLWKKSSNNEFKVFSKGR